MPNFCFSAKQYYILSINIIYYLSCIVRPMEVYNNVYLFCRVWYNCSDRKILFLQKISYILLRSWNFWKNLPKLYPDNLNMVYEF